MGYDGWFGLDLFPYRDNPVDFMTLSRDNLRLGCRVVELMKTGGAVELRRSSQHGPEMARLILDSIRKVND